MLVVSRRPGQSILIGDNIEVFIIAVDGTQVRVGVNAPRAIRVLRRELLTQVESENRRAVGSSLAQPDDLHLLAQQVTPPGEKAT